MSLNEYFDGDELKSVLGFFEIMERLSGLPFLKSPMSFKYKVEYKNGILTQRIDDFDEDAFRSFLLDFRKLIAQDSTANWKRVCNIIEKSSIDDQIKERIRECRTVLKELNIRGVIRYTIGNAHQIPEEIVDTWINGHYFHEDEDKKRQLDPKSMGHMTHKFIFIKNVVDQAHVLFILRNILVSKGLHPDKPDR